MNRPKKLLLILGALTALSSPPLRPAYGGGVQIVGGDTNTVIAWDWRRAPATAVALGFNIYCGDAFNVSSDGQYTYYDVVAHISDPKARTYRLLGLLEQLFQVHGIETMKVSCVVSPYNAAGDALAGVRGARHWQPTCAFRTARRAAGTVIED